jgi:hypothetical protein
MFHAFFSADRAFLGFDIYQFENARVEGNMGAHEKVIKRIFTVLEEDSDRPDQRSRGKANPLFTSIFLLEADVHFVYNEHKLFRDGCHVL